jgi:GTPase SAR1 family protein
MELKDLAPQTLTLAVLGGNGVGKSTFISSFIVGFNAESDTGAPPANVSTSQQAGTSEKKIEVDSVVHKVVVVDVELAQVDVPGRNFFTGSQVRSLFCIIVVPT